MIAEMGVASHFFSLSRVVEVLKERVRGARTWWKGKLTLTYKQLQHSSFLLRNAALIQIKSILS